MSQDLDQQVRKKVTDFFRQAPRRYPVFSILLGTFVLVLIIWYIPQWQMPKSGLSLKDRLHQINENRKTVAQIVGGVFILVGLYIAWVRSKAMRDQAEVAREQQLTDLYVKAVEQLGSEKLQIRLGGIYALERIARESPKDHWPIMEVLTAFVRENAPRKDETETHAAFDKAGSTPTPGKIPTDIQAVLTVLGRTAIPYAQKDEKRSLDLIATHLVRSDLRGCKLQGVYLSRANLQGAYLQDSNLREASLWRANLEEADLSRANLQGVDFTGANIQYAYLNAANLQSAIFGAVYLVEGIGKFNIELTRLEGADLRDVDFRGAKGLTADQVTDALWDETTKWPEDFSPPPSRKGKNKEEK